VSGGWEPLPGETPIDVSGLRIKGIGIRAELNRAEAENVRKAVVRYLAARPSRRSAPFTLTWVKRLHRQMFGDVWAWAGEFRRENLNLGCDWHQVPFQVQTLLDDLAFWERQGDELPGQAARLHHRAVRVYPFLNGNGRWARMLANVWLKRHRHPVTAWPEETIGKKSVIRHEYLAAVRAADEGDEGPLIALHRRFSPGPKPDESGP
jgi:Fic-DOC domain mobile mystery protein B